MMLLIFLRCFIHPKDDLENTKLTTFKSSLNTGTSDLEYLCKYCRNYKDKHITKYLEEECDILQKLENHLNGKSIYDLITNEYNDKNHIRDILFIIRIQKILVDLVAPDGDTPLIWAVQNNDINVVMLLILEGGCDVNFQDANNDTPLHIACSEGNEVIVSFLFLKGARKDLRNFDSKLPVQMVDHIKYPTIAKLFIK